MIRIWRKHTKTIQQWRPDLVQGVDSLLNHKLRSLLTMMGMIFGVAAVVAMLSVGAGAQQEVMAFIEQLGVRNLIVEAKEGSNWEATQKVRRTSPGLTLRDYNDIRNNVPGITQSTPRKKFFPTKALPKPRLELPVVYGVTPSYATIISLKVSEGRFFEESEDASAVPVCVLGSSAKESLFGATPPIGQYLKLDEQWFQVIGVASPQLAARGEVPGLPSEDANNLIYAPINSVLFRVADSQNYFKDEIDGIYLHLASANDSSLDAILVRGILSSSHRGAGDFAVIVPAELLAERHRTEQLFNRVMVAIASISLLVGGIGIMNIMLAAILERTREVGLRRAVGATQKDIVRQFLVEAVLISFAGGLLGIVLGFGMSELIAWFAGWSTVVTATSVLLAFVVSISVGLIFGTYPALKAARLDPVEAIRYE